VKKKYIVLLVAIIALAAGAPFLKTRLDAIRVELPTYQRPGQVVKLEQNWTDEQRHRFHHTPQGTRLLPASWLMALEQPCLKPTYCGSFTDPDYLSRFGFIPSPKSDLNPYGLPVGFAVDKDVVDPIDKPGDPIVGLTCAACHTGELHYGNYAVQIEGAPAMIEVAAFQKALGLALGFNTQFPLSVWRYGRFEERVLGANASDDDKRRLREKVDALLTTAEAALKATSERHIYDNQAGFMRTDALARIGNQVFAEDMKLVDNYAPANAPVRYPQIWNASWFNWVQYNSSIADPLARNVGEALGVRAVAQLSGPDAGKFVSSVNIDGLRWIEDTLAGPAPMQGLASPKWPAQFPPLDAQKVTAGAALYQAHCQGCHLPPLPKLMAEYDQWRADPTYQPKNWWKSGSGSWYVEVTDIPIDEIGTDPKQATDFKTRTADSGALGKGRISAEDGLLVVTEGIANRFFTERGIPMEQRPSWSGGRATTDEKIRADLIYKARPLNGIWAAAPFLHNGSVPTLDALLSPDDAARPAQFWMASKEFDPVKVGYAGTRIDGATLYDTTVPGNANTGHRFKNAPKGNGVIGPELSAEQRAQIIEYLKSL
jgi:hypothetical protein